MTTMRTSEHTAIIAASIEYRTACEAHEAARLAYDADPRGPGRDLAYNTTCTTRARRERELLDLASGVTYALAEADICMGCSGDRVGGRCPNKECTWGKTRACGNDDHYDPFKGQDCDGFSPECCADKEIA